MSNFGKKCLTKGLACGNIGKLSDEGLEKPGGRQKTSEKSGNTVKNVLTGCSECDILTQLTSERFSQRNKVLKKIKKSLDKRYELC